MSADPRYLVQVDPSHALPGENAPLLAEPDRTEPVTDEEALGVLRRRKAAALSRQYQTSDPADIAAAGLPPTLEEALAERLPRALPPWTESKEMVTIRLSPQLWALLYAKFELEGSWDNFAMMVETFMYEAARSPIASRAEVAERRQRMLDETVYSQPGDQ